MKNIFVGLMAIVAVAVTSAASAVPIQGLTDLQTITFWERTGAGPTPNVFAPGDGALLSVRANPLGPGNTDLSGAEYYDVFYSNADGVFMRTAHS